MSFSKQGSIVLSALLLSSLNALAADISAADNAGSAHAKARLNEAQVSEVNARIAAANQIVENVSADAQTKNLDAKWRINLLASLFNVKSSELQNIASAAHSVDMAYQLSNAASSAARQSNPVAKNLGSGTDSLVFTPKTPCRFIDTRVTGGPITTPRDYDTQNFGSANGGDSGCTLPGTGEPGVAVNVTVVVPAGGAGYVGIRPYGSTNTTSFINWGSGGAPAGIANAGIIATALNGADYEFEVFKGGTGSPQFILDYFGYFSAAAPTALSCVTTNITSASVGTGHNSVSSTACPAGYSATAALCGAAANVVVNTFQVNTSSNIATCYYDNNTGGTATIDARVVCCQVP